MRGIHFATEHAKLIIAAARPACVGALAGSWERRELSPHSRPAGLFLLCELPPLHRQRNPPATVRPSTLARRTNRRLSR